MQPSKELPVLPNMTGIAWIVDVRTSWNRSSADPLPQRKFSSSYPPAETMDVELKLSTETVAQFPMAGMVFWEKPDDTFPCYGTI